MTADEKRGLIAPARRAPSVARQCELLGLARSSFYYEERRESEWNLGLMRRIDEQYTRTPFYGVERMTRQLRKEGEEVGPKRVRRLMRAMGLEAIYPKPCLSVGAPESVKYPYLLRELAIGRPNQVWCADITYIRMARGFVYLVAVMDWFSRYVLAWRTSVTLEADFCLAALEQALGAARPEIFNTDQGTQFTSRDWTGRLEAARVKISMDGRGRCFDNIFIERLWRSVKYEEVYLRDYASRAETDRGLGNYFEFYNGERLHQGLDYRTPAEVHYEKTLGWE